MRTKNPGLMTQIQDFVNDFFFREYRSLIYFSAFIWNVRSVYGFSAIHSVSADIFSGKELHHP